MRHHILSLLDHAPILGFIGHTPNYAHRISSKYASFTPAERFLLDACVCVFMGVRSPFHINCKLIFASSTIFAMQTYAWKV